MKYKVGDKVRVRGDLEAGKDYRSVPFLKRMECFKNKIAEITKSEDGYYGLSIDNISYAWTDEMFRPAEFKIWCETEREKQAVLEELEKEGYVWKDSNKKPTEYINDTISCAYPIGFYLREDRLSYSLCKGSFDIQSLEEFTPSEFTEIDFSHKSKKIIIEQTKTGAKATYEDKWSYVEGDFDDASRQALAEVLCPFKVGDRVQVKCVEAIGVVERIKESAQAKVVDEADGSCGWWYVNAIEPYTEPLYNAKLFCIKSSDSNGVFTKGYIYTVENGVFINEHVGEFSPFKNLNDINKTLYAQFMEVKGGLDE